MKRPLTWFILRSSSDGRPCSKIIMDSLSEVLRLGDRKAALQVVWTSKSKNTGHHVESWRVFYSHKFVAANFNSERQQMCFCRGLASNSDNGINKWLIRDSDHCMVSPRYFCFSLAFTCSCLTTFSSYSSTSTHTYPSIRVSRVPVWPPNSGRGIDLPVRNRLRWRFSPCC